MKKPLVFLMVMALIFIVLKVVFPEMEEFANLGQIKFYHDKWLLLYKKSPVKIITLFILFNTLLASLPIPGISMISFFGGALFGFAPGAIFSSIATAVGNLVGFFIARYFLQQWVMEHYGKRVLVFKEEWQSFGPMALFSFRLFPLVPSFIANLVMGVSTLNWWTFFWVSWVGRIPMVVIYAWAGVQFSQIKEMEDIVSFPVLSILIALALLPWGLRKLLQLTKSSHTH